MHTSFFYYVISHTQFFDILPCVILTGRGFPDIATRAFTHFLAVPPFILFDIDAIATPNLRHLRLESVRRCVTDDLHSRIIEFGIGSRRYSKTVLRAKSHSICYAMIRVPQNTIIKSSFALHSKPHFNHDSAKEFRPIEGPLPQGKETLSVSSIHASRCDSACPSGASCQKWKRIRSPCSTRTN